MWLKDEKENMQFYDEDRISIYSINLFYQLLKKII